MDPKYFWKYFMEIFPKISEIFLPNFSGNISKKIKVQLLIVSIVNARKFELLWVTTKTIYLFTVECHVGPVL